MYQLRPEYYDKVKFSVGNHNVTVRMDNVVIAQFRARPTLIDCIKKFRTICADYALKNVILGEMGPENVFDDEPFYKV